ncbi:Asp23/Gls24 family envelope stress response protein [Brevibacterium gallinarum]|uniref:Alkaline shock response membrane anchor protein AmaP n=1 Tax=Brevibacterium gallinarum TaxID=2762220 RepID=A0ABR8WSX3_9MICO|nr:alkaline shock response membrane anchor protein AmaP [Brevibacterium gallinarum]MBD8019761.1 alkaline shock response membrane anchor protein AmaP [Brevibacterium gallinarum]
MKKLNGAANRLWLAVIGIALVVAGALWILTGSGLGTRWFSAWPAADSSAADLDVPVSATQLPALAAAVGIGLAAIGLWWLVRQFPQSRAAKPLRMQEDARTGMTFVPSQAVADAVALDVEQLNGVDNATAVLRGSLSAPQLALQIDADERADFDELFADVRRDIIRRCAETIGAKLASCDVEINIVRSRRRARSVRIS